MLHDLSAIPSHPVYAAAALVALGAAAAIDARTGYLPNPLVGIAAVAGAVGTAAVTGPWKPLELAALGIAAYIVALAMNATSRALSNRNEKARARRKGVEPVLPNRDCLGMGDAKWSAAAILAFGWPPVLAAWFSGSALAVAWMLACRMAGRPADKVFFGPFLFIGLVTSPLHISFFGLDHFLS